MISFTTKGIEDEPYNGTYYRYITESDNKVTDKIELS